MHVGEDYCSEHGTISCYRKCISQFWIRGCQRELQEEIFHGCGVVGGGMHGGHPGGGMRRGKRCACVCLYRFGRGGRGIAVQRGWREHDIQLCGGRNQLRRIRRHSRKDQQRHAAGPECGRFIQSRSFARRFHPGRQAFSGARTAGRPRQHGHFPGRPHPGVRDRQPDNHADYHQWRLRLSGLQLQCGGYSQCHRRIWLRFAVRDDDHRGDQSDQHQPDQRLLYHLRWR
jgi:hypothetical protein